ncbi:hypothetical protein QOT17_013753 [Balamuthia mandrillaris]
MLRLPRLLGGPVLGMGQKFLQDQLNQRAEQVRQQVFKALFIQALLTVLLVGLFVASSQHHAPQHQSKNQNEHRDLLSGASSSSSSSSPAFMWSTCVAILLLLFSLFGSSSSASSLRSTTAGWTVLLVAILPYVQQALLLVEAHRFALDISYDYANNLNDLWLAALLFALLVALKSVPLRLLLRNPIAASSVSPSGFYVSLEAILRFLLFRLQLNHAAAGTSPNLDQVEAKLWVLVVSMVWHIHLSFQLSSHQTSLAVMSIHLAASVKMEGTSWTSVCLRIVKLLDEAPSVAHSPGSTWLVCMLRCSVPLVWLLLHLASPSAFPLSCPSTTPETVWMMNALCCILMGSVALEWRAASQGTEKPSDRIVLLTGVTIVKKAMIAWVFDWKMNLAEIVRDCVVWLKKKTNPPAVPTETEGEQLGFPQLPDQQPSQAPLSPQETELEEEAQEEEQEDKEKMNDCVVLTSHPLPPTPQAHDQQQPQADPAQDVQQRPLKLLYIGMCKACNECLIDTILCSCGHTLFCHRCITSQTTCWCGRLIQGIVIQIPSGLRTANCRCGGCILVPVCGACGLRPVSVLHSYPSGSMGWRCNHSTCRDTFAVRRWQVPNVYSRLWFFRRRQPACQT